MALQGLGTMRLAATPPRRVGCCSARARRVQRRSAHGHFPWCGLLHGSSVVGPVACGAPKQERCSRSRPCRLRSSGPWGKSACEGRLAHPDNWQPRERQGYYVWARLIEALADLGYGPNNLVRGPSHACASQAWV